MMLRMRKLLEDEKSRGEAMRKELVRLKSKSSGSINTEDSIRISEMEVENDKLRQDYQLLRNSIDRGVHHEELEGLFDKFCGRSNDSYSFIRSASYCSSRRKQTAT